MKALTPQEHFVNHIHAPYSTLVEYSSLLDHNDLLIIISFCIVTRCLKSVTVHVSCFIPVCWSPMQCMVYKHRKLQPYIYWSPTHTQPWLHLPPSYSSVSRLPFLMLLISQTNQLMPKTYPSTSKYRHYLGPMLAAWRWKIWSSAQA